MYTKSQSTCIRIAGRCNKARRIFQTGGSEISGKFYSKRAEFYFRQLCPNQTKT